MTPDPDHVRMVERTLHTIQCRPCGMPYERYGEQHRKEHHDLAKQLVAGFRNAGYTLTTTKEDQ